MREIEFRAWSKSYEEIVKVDLLGKNKILSSRTWFDLKDIELMQYTGLKDKNGVKIFEGDIVTYEYENKELKTKKLTVFFDEEDCSFSLAYKGKPHLNMEKSDVKYYKVIGNIYENKELLENV